MKRLNTKLIDDISFISVNGDMEFDDSEQLDDTLTDIISNTNHPQIIIDLYRCNYIDSRSLGVLLTNYTKAKKAQGEMVLCNLQDTLKEVISMTTGSKYIKIFNNTEESKQSFFI